MRPSTRKTRRLVALWPLLAMAALLVALAAGCGSDSSSGPGNNTTPKAVHGHAFKGGIDGAACEVRRVHGLPVPAEPHFQRHRYRYRRDGRL